jgi:hypothetical protein
MDVSLWTFLLRKRQLMVGVVWNANCQLMRQLIVGIRYELDWISLRYLFQGEPHHCFLCQSGVFD